MSKYAHRQPIATWSGVVLLSALLLSPVTAGAFLRVLLDGTAPQNRPVQPVNPTRTTDHGSRTTAQTPRRSDEEERLALRAAALSGRLRAVRLDSDPDNPTPTYALFVSARAVIRIPDDPVLAALPPDAPVAALRPTLARPTPPRAPPV